MKKNEFQELKNKKQPELLKSLEETRGKIRELSFKKPLAGLKNPHELGALKKKAARLLTLINQKNDQEK